MITKQLLRNIMITYFVVTVFSDLCVYTVLSIGLQVQNRSICQSSFYVERKIRDKQSKSKTVQYINQRHFYITQ